MNSCAQCGESVQAGSRFCEECGTPVAQGTTSDALSPEDVLGKVERTLYFRITRGYAWAILILASIALVASTISLIPAAINVWWGGSTAVSVEEIRKVGASGESDRSNKEREDIDPARLAKLDRIVYEIIRLLPEEREQETYGGRKAKVRLEVEDLRRLLKNQVRHIETTEGQIAVLEELKGILSDFLVHERLNAIEKYFEIKVQKERVVEARKSAARQELLWYPTSIGLSVTIITFGVMILVLLAIERNTRGAQRKA